MPPQVPGNQMPMGIQYDEQGRPFTYVGGTTRRSYISPVAMGTGQRPDDTTSILRQAPRWNQNTGKWETPIDWGNIATMGVGALGGVGALSAMGAFGGGAGAAAGAGGAAPSAAPGAFGISATAPTFGAAAPAAGGGIGAAGGAAGGAAASAGSSVLSRTLRALAGAAPMVGALTAPRQSLGGSMSDIMNQPGVREMLELKMKQARRADPLHEALITMSTRLLPNSARGGSQ